MELRAGFDPFSSMQQARVLGVWSLPHSLIRDSSRDVGLRFRSAIFPEPS